MYEKVTTDLNFVDREKQVEKFWEEEHIFVKEHRQPEKGQTLCVLRRAANGQRKPHIGHVLTRVIKDMIPRYRTMKGYMVPRKAGWDTHGLRWSWRLRRNWAWTARSRSSSTVWSRFYRGM